MPGTETLENIDSHAEQVGENIRQVGTEAISRVRQAGSVLKERAKEATRAAESYVHDKPWSALGIAAGVGIVIGFLFGRRNGHDFASD